MFDYTMYQDGVHFFRVAGDCSYVAFDGEGPPFDFWNPIVEGHLSAEVFSLLQQLEVERWSTIEDYGSFPGVSRNHSSQEIRYRDRNWFCFGPCLVPSTNTNLAWLTVDIASELSERGHPVEASSYEVAVIENGSSAGDYLLVLDWAANQPLNSFVSEAEEQLGPDPYETIGHIVSAVEEPWFKTALQRYRDVMPTLGGSRGIGVRDVTRQDKVVTHGRFIREIP
ncbi:MAG: hypothetical protein AAF211_05320 [Myxococcota bacterium]